ncbi:MAG: MBL fold metallo-hydrolase [Gammaproteobacteria bacterium]|nr:MBL fold metallo-hydrolase [Gammaproteobacteria bacterium]
MIIILCWLLPVLARPAAALAAEHCGAVGAALQVLGSGGPIADDARAGSAYLLWRDGRARVMVDAGSGAALRFGQSGAALIKSGYFSPRRRPLAVSGPTSGGVFPGLAAFLQRTFDSQDGVFGYLAGALDGSGGQFPLAPEEIEARPGVVTAIAERPDVRIAAIGVDHGPVPALAYRVEMNGVSVVFSGDQTGRGEGFWAFAGAADVLVMHHAIPASAGRTARRLHATPAQIGRGAARAGVGRLVLSHFMARSFADLDHSLAEIGRHYRGPVTLAEDLLCLPLTPRPIAGADHKRARNLLGSGADAPPSFGN